MVIASYERCLLLAEKYAVAGPTREQDWQTVIDVTRGFGREFAEAENTLTLAQLRERMASAGKQLTDVASILERLRG